MITHGHTVNGKRSATYRSWQCMRARCNRASDPYFAYYGGRGIRVCERWLVFENFLADMGERPAGTTLERKENDGDYTPGNCYWATAREQTLNRSNTVWIEIAGRRQCLLGWCRETGISHQVAVWRLKNGWPPQAAVLTPARGRTLKGLDI